MKGGNVDLLIQKVIQSCKEKKGKRQEAKGNKINTEIVYLDDLKIIPCKSCGVLPQKGFCIYHDYMEKASHKL